MSDMLSISPKAREMLDQFAEQADESNEMLLRVEIVGRGPHGGHVDLSGVDAGKAIIAFGGGCQGCGMVDVTLKQGVEVMIKDNVPGISEVVDATDHTAGTNPFY